MGGWASLGLHQRINTLHRVQTHRMTAAHSEGGANHAQKRRFANMEALLYGAEGVHLKQLRELGKSTNDVTVRAANMIKRAYRLHRASKTAARRAKEAAVHRECNSPNSPTSNDSPMAALSLLRSMDEPTFGAAAELMEFTGSPGDGLSIDRAYLRQISHDLPDMA